MSIPVLLSLRTGKYHFALDDGSPVCCSELDPADQWMLGKVMYIVNDVLCPTCVQARQYFPELQNSQLSGVEQCVYIIRQAGSYLYKIGIAADPVKRFRNIQGANPHPLQLEWYSDPCDSTLARVIENQVHRAYRHARAGQAHQREWFNLGPHEVDAIRSMITDGIDAVC